MLVSVALVLVIMLMFTTIFQIASGSMSVQKGMAENDQRARTLTILLKADLDKRTFRQLNPIIPDEQTTYGSIIDESKRLGYFYISENDPYNDADDVLKFTVNAANKQKNTDTTPYVGKASPLEAPPGAPNWGPNQIYELGEWVTSPTQSGIVYQAQQYLTVGDHRSGATPPTWPTSGTVNDGDIRWIARTSVLDANGLPVPGNEPVWDDAVGSINSSQSSKAEVCYFLRNGILYRRVLLIREPLKSTYVDQPKNSGGNDYFDPAGGLYVGAGGNPIFWNDFDFSAYYMADPNNAGEGFLQFHGSTSLENDASTTFGGQLGNPQYRFGHHFDDSSSSGATNPNDNTPMRGKPREYIFDGSGNFAFIGAFTQQETSSPQFEYPYSASASVIPSAQNPFTRTDLALNNAGAVSIYADGPRRAEDVVMTNVHAFDIKVWDDALLQFVDLGHSTAGGNFHINSRTNTTYGPSYNTGTLPNRVFDTWHPAVDIDTAIYLGNDPPPFRPVNYSGSAAGVWKAAWTANTAYAIGDIVRRPDGGGYTWDWTFVYRAKNAGTSGASMQGSSWPTVEGRTVSDGSTNPIIWETLDNRVPLRAIQITVRYFDISSQQMRQMTLVHSLVD